MNTIPKPPKGVEYLQWLGPGLLWMLSAAGSGELLFTPRVAALYGYSLLWAMLAAVILKWFINREIGRFTVCTGQTVLHGFDQLPGPRHWVTVVILAPQLLVAVATLAGLAGVAASSLGLLVSVPPLWVVASLITLSGLVTFAGQYNKTEKAAAWLAVGLSLAVLAAAFSVFSRPADFLQGLMPTMPAQVNYAEVLPWLGFMLSGAAGLIWHSYWIQARGYGAAQAPVNSLSTLSGQDKLALKGWLKVMTASNTLAVVGAMMLALAFLVLGAELLHPRGLVPENQQMPAVLGRLLGDVWGPVGFWYMVVSIVVTFCSTLLSGQDGFLRMFREGSRLIGQYQGNPLAETLGLTLLLVVLPIVVYGVAGEPVGLLKLAGAVEAIHIPVVTGLTLYLNHRVLPTGLGPSKASFVMTLLAGLFFAAFAGIYLFQLSP